MPVAPVLIHVPYSYGHTGDMICPWTMRSAYTARSVSLPPHTPAIIIPEGNVQVAYAI